MKKSGRKKKAPKGVLRLPDLDYAKGAVLNALGSPESKRAYEFAIDDFVAWYCSEPRLAFRARLRGDDRAIPGLQAAASERCQRSHRPGAMT
jgi:hypothetical protein